MSRRRQYRVSHRLDLPAADPAAVWALVADFTRFPAWTSAERMEGVPADLPRVGDTVVAVHRFRPVRYRVEYEVAEWDAGHGFRLEVAGLPAVRDVEWTCRVEGVVEPDRTWAQVELAESGDAAAALVSLVRAAAQGRLRRAGRRLVRRLGA